MKKKGKKCRSITDIKNYMKTQIGKSHEATHKSTIIREITGDKKRILTVALYNGTHNRLMLHHN